MEFTLIAYPDHSDGLLGAAALLTLHRVVHMGHDVMTRAVNPRGRRAAAEVKIRMPGIAGRPAAASRSEPVDFFGGGNGGQAWIDRGFRRRFDGAGSRRLRCAAAVCPGDGLLDLSGRNHSGDQETKHNVDAAREIAVAALPASDGPRTDAEPPGDATLLEAKCVERCAELGRGRGAPASPPEGRVARFDEDRQCGVPNQSLDLD